MVETTLVLTLIFQYNILSQNTRQLDFHRILRPILYLRINMTSSLYATERDSLKRHLMDMYGAHSQLVYTYDLSLSTVDSIYVTASELDLRSIKARFLQRKAGCGGRVDDASSPNTSFGCLAS